MTFEATYLGSNGWLIKFKKSNLIIDPWLKGDLIFPPGEWFFKGSLEEEISIDKKDCLFTWGEGPRPEGFPGLTELGV